MNSGNVTLLPTGLNVSRETENRLQEFVSILLKWNNAINLISRTTTDQIWIRHILDSIQVFSYGNSALRWVDIGSGGGFPGLVVAIMALELAPQMRVILVESDQRKAAFLRQASTTLGLSTEIISERIENVAPLNANVVSARALAPLSALCSFARPHLAENGTVIFLKGKSAGKEIADARKQWNFGLDSHVSVTDASAVVLILKEIQLV